MLNLRTVIDKLKCNLEKAKFELLNAYKIYRSTLCVFLNSSPKLKMIFRGFDQKQY